MTFEQFVLYIVLPCAFIILFLRGARDADDNDKK